MSDNDFLEIQINELCYKIADFEANQMEPGTTINEFGVKCAKAAFNAALRIAKATQDINSEIYKK